jgi:polyhydroxyalkanoate synthesis repressor PhaR
MKSQPKSRTVHRDKIKSQRIIKKYSDRRLYDASASRYVTLDEIARMVREGIELKVVDARSGKDLTFLILTQIILEDARARETSLPLHLLEQLVRASDKATHEFVSWYLNSTLELYQKAQAALSTRLPEAKAVVARPVEFVRNLLAGHVWPPPAQGPDASEVERLRRQVAELQARLDQREKPRRRTGTARRSSA